MGTGRSGGGSAKLRGEIGKRVNEAYRGDKDPTSDEFKQKYLLNANPHRDDMWMSGIDYKRMKYLEAQYLENCQRVAYVTDLRLAGYDVEAMRKGYGDIDAGFYSMGRDNSFFNIYENAKWSTLNASTEAAMMRQIEKLLPNSGDRAIIAVAWKSGGAHATNIINNNGKLFVVDGQVNKVTELATKMSSIDTHRLYVLPTGSGMVREYKTINPKLAKYVLKRRKDK